MKSHDIKIGDTILITGPTTGAQEFIIKSMFVNEKPAEKAVKGDDVTIPVDFVVRASDKVYKMVDSKLPELA